MVTDRARLSHLYATVSDLARARAFWTQVLGLEVLVDGHLISIDSSSDLDAR